jgi:hypothetical protein
MSVDRRAILLDILRWRDRACRSKKEKRIEKIRQVWHINGYACVCGFEPFSIRVVLLRGCEKI